MTLFRDGPAKGSTVLLLRGPDYLRVAEEPGRTDAGRFFPLDAVRDDPAEFPGCTFHAYRRLNPRVRDSIWKGRAKYVAGEYALVEPQPEQATMLSNELWRAYCIELKAADERGQGGHLEQP